MPAPNSLRTRETASGFFLGNDLHTVKEIWEAHEALQAYISSNPARATTWWATDLPTEVKRQQGKLRSRRTKVWNAIKACAEMRDAEGTQVAETLDNVCAIWKLGVSRVETWADQVRSAEAKQNNWHIIDIAIKYNNDRLDKISATTPASLSPVPPPETLISVLANFTRIPLGMYNKNNRSPTADAPAAAAADADADAPAAAAADAANTTNGEG